MRGLPRKTAKYDDEKPCWFAFQANIASACGTSRCGLGYKGVEMPCTQINIPPPMPGITFDRITFIAMSKHLVGC